MDSNIIIYIFIGALTLRIPLKSYANAPDYVSGAFRSR